METAVVVAIVTGVVSLVVAVISQIGNRRTHERLARLTTELERQKLHLGSELDKQRIHLSNQLERQRLELSSELEERRASHDARREYEYRARIRLYEECEPLLFEAIELAERAARRVRSLARAARGGYLLPDGRGWLDHPGYYLTSTAFFLLSPATTSRILQRRLTSIDLALDAGLVRQYEVLKLITMSFTEDFELAQRSPPRPYDPDKADPEEPDADALKREHPATYWRQGLYLGTLEVMVESLVPDGGVARCKSFGELLAELDDEGSRVRRVLPELIDLFGSFHPRSRPVLWRVLLYQAHLYRMLLETQRGASARDGALRAPEPPGPDWVALFDWKKCGGAELHAMRREVLVAYEHLEDKVRAVNERLGRR